MAGPRLGFVGARPMGQAAHLWNYAAIGDCELTALAEPDEKLRRDIAARYGIARTYRTHVDMLAAEDLDGVVAVLPFSLHEAIVPTLAAYGRPLIIEKPMADSLHGGEAIAKAAEATPLYVAYHKRSDPAAAYAKERIYAYRQNGEVGQPRYVRITMPPGDWVAGGMSHVVTAATPRQSAQPAKNPSRRMYAEFVNYYIHQVNLVRFLLDEPYGFDYVDDAGVLAAGQSASGVTVALEMQPYSTTASWQEQVLICFERGWIRIDFPPPLAVNRPGSVSVYSDPGAGATPMLTTPTLPNVHAMRMQAEAFFAAIRGQKTQLCSAAEALDDLRVCEQYVNLRQARSDEQA